MEIFYLNLSIFTVFLKNKNMIFKIRRSKVTDCAALILFSVLGKLSFRDTIHAYQANQSGM